nr:DUF1206 domain-containing protein [Lysinibacter cavernae]
MAANGLVHMLIGFIALTIAWGGTGSADQSGALAAVAAGPGGTLVLWIAGVALLGLALWQLTLVVWETAPNWRTLQFRRLKDVGKAMGFSGMGIASLYFAIGGRSDSAENSRTFSQVMLGSPGGIIVLCAVGGTVAGVGFGLIYRGVSQNFREDFETPGSLVTDRVVRVFGVAGHVAKGTALVVVGGLFIAAAVFADPEQAGGLDGALKYVAALPAGTILLTLVATGFILYGFYLFARARYLRRI